VNAPLSSRRPVVLVIVLVAVFAAGIGAGVLADRLILDKPVIRARVVAGDMSRVLDGLDLTVEQRRKADSILSRRAPASESAMLQFAELLRAVSDSVDRELRQILTPLQQARLDSLRQAGPQMMLKRKRVTPGGTTVDTVLIRDTGSARIPP
jgi:hypothetical protein